MKNLLLFVLSNCAFLQSIHAQVPKAMPPDAYEFYNKSMPLLRPPVKKIVLQIAETIKHSKINADSLSETLYKNAALKGMSKTGIEGVAVLILVQASRDTDGDLKKMVLEISHKNDQHNNLAKDNNGDAQKSKLQTIMDCKSGMAEEISFAMKKISGRQQDIIDNLK